MKYYIVTSEVFESLDITKIRYAHNSQDKTEWVVTTTETVEDATSFTSAENLSIHTNDTFSFWTGQGSGLSIEDIEETEYLEGL